MTAHAHLAFQQQRRHMLDALIAWLAAAPDPDDVQHEADATCAAVRKVVGDETR